eukprot:scaffold420579_cov40-Prasinocladus_malaysianus.AAC.1
MTTTINKSSFRNQLAERAVSMLAEHSKVRELNTVWDNFKVRLGISGSCPPGHFLSNGGRSREAFKTWTKEAIARGDARDLLEAIFEAGCWSKSLDLFAEELSRTMASQALPPASGVGNADGGQQQRADNSHHCQAASSSLSAGGSSSSNGGGSSSLYHDASSSLAISPPPPPAHRPDHHQKGSSKSSGSYSIHAATDDDASSAFRPPAARPTDASAAT